MIGPELNFTPRGLYIGGEWQEAAEGGRLASINPSTGEHLGEVPDATASDVDRAVRAARAAFESEWGRMPLLERAGCLERLAARLLAHRDELGLMDCVDAGNALSGMVGDVDWTVDTLRYFAGLVTEIKGETSSYGPRHLNFTRRQPYGVVAKINAFNHPFRFCAEKAAAALAAGNTVVVKAADQAPLSSLRFAELCEGIMPPGVVNVVTGGAETGSAMVRHPLVERIGFVGSVETGRIIAREAAEGLKEVTLELGGKNPIIIFPDADPAKAAKAAMKGMNMNRQGQSCSSTSRVFVHESLHGAVLDALVAEAEALPVGLPWEEGKEVGPIVSRAAVRTGDGIHRLGPRGGGAARRRRRPPRGSRAREWVLRLPYGVRRRRRLDAHRARGDLRPGDVGVHVVGPRRRDCESERPALRPHRRHRHERFGQGHGDRRSGGGRVRVDQLHRALPGRPLRRLEAQRRGSRGEPGRAAELHAHQEREPALVTAESLPPEL